MSWARDEWKVDLAPQVLKKVSEYEENLDRNRKELQQRQFQIDSLNATLQKQKLLLEEEKNVSNQYKRDLQLVSKKCDEYEKTRSKVMADMQMKDSRINCLDGQLLKEKQSLENEIANCNRFKLDLETNIAKYDKLLSEFSKLQKETQVQQRKVKVNGETSRNSSYRSSSDSESDKEIFALPKEISRRPAQQEHLITPLKTRTYSSSSSGDEMAQTFNQEGRIKEQEKTIDCLRKEKDALNEKCQNSVTEVDLCQSKLVAMENKQKQLVQQIECSRHNVEATRRHQEEKMKEKEREYREEISTQNKALMQLEQELKESKVKLEQANNCSNAKVKEVEVTIKNIQRENVVAHETITRLEHEKSQQRLVVESCEKQLAELRQELNCVKEDKDLVIKSQHANVQTIENLKQMLEINNIELEEKKRLIASVEESSGSVVAEERRKFLEQMKIRENERDSAVARLNEVQKLLEMSSLSNSEKQHDFSSQIEELMVRIEKSEAIVEQKEKELLSMQASLEEKDILLSKLAELNEKCSGPEELKELSEEMFLLQEKFECSVKSCESLSQQVKDSEMKVSHVDAQRQMLQMDIDDKDKLMATLEEQKISLETNYQETLQRMSECTDNLSQANKEIDCLKNKNDALEREAREKESRAKQLQDEFLQLRSTLESCVLQKSRLAEELSKTKEERDQRYSYYETEVEELKTSLDETRNAGDISERAFVSELKAELDKTNKILVERDNEFNEVKLQFKAMEEEFNTTQVNLDKVEKDLECKNTNMKMIMAEKSKIMSDLAKVEQERDDKIESLSKLQTVVAEKDQVINSLKINKEEILGKKDADLQGVECKIKELMEECTAKSLKLVDESGKLEELTIERDRLRESLERLRVEVKEKDQERQKYVDQRKESERSCAEYKTTITQLEANLSDTIEKVQKERTSFEERCCKLKEDLISCKETVQEKSNIVEEIKNSLECLQSEKECLAIDNERLRMENTNTLQETEKANSRCEEYFKKLSEKEKVAEEYKFNCEQLTSELATTKELSQSTQNKLNEDLSRLRDTVDKEKEEVRAVKEQLEKQLASVMDTNAENERLLTVLETVKSEKSSICDNYKNVLLENKIFTNKLAVSEQEKAECASKVEQLTKEIETIQEKAELVQETLREDMKNLRNELTQTNDKLNQTKFVLSDKEVEIEMLKSAKESMEFEVENIKSEKETISKKCEISTEENKHFMEKLTESKEQAMEYKIKVEQVEQELMNIKDGVEITQAKLNESLLNANKELAQEKHNLQSVKQVQSEMKVAIQALKDEKASLEFQIGNITSENKVISEKFEKCQDDNRSFVEKLSTSEQQVNELNVMIEKLRHELSTIREGAETSQETLKENLSNLQEELVKNKEVLATTKDQLVEKETALQVKTTEHQALLFEIENLKEKEKIECEKFETYRSESKILNEKLVIREQQINEQKLLVEQLQRELLDGKCLMETNEVSVLENTAKLKAELDEEKGKLETTMNILKEKENDNQIVNAEKESLLFQIESINEEKNNYLEKLQMVVDEKKKYEEKQRTNEQQEIEYKCIEEKLKQELSEIKNQRESEQTILTDRIDTLQHELDAAKEMLEEAAEQQKESRVAVQMLTKEKESLAFELENMTNEKKEALEKMALSSNENNICLEKLLTCQKEIADYKSMLDQLQSEVSQLKNAKETLESRETMLDDNMTVMKDELTSEKERLKKTNGELGESKALVSSLNNEREAMKMEIEELKTKNGQISEKLENAKHQCSVYEERISESDKLSSQYKIKELHSEEIKEQLRSKQLELDCVQVQFEEMKEKAAKEIADLKEVLENKDYSLGENAYEANKLKAKVESHLDQIQEYELKCRKQEEESIQKVGELEHSIEQLRQDGEVKSKATRDAMELVESLQSQLDTKINEAHLIEKEFEKERERVLEQIKVARQDVDETQRNIEYKKEQIMLLEGQLADSKTSKDRKHYEEISTAKEENGKLNEKIRQCIIENTKLKAEMKSSRDVLETQLRKKDECLLELDCKLDKARDEKCVVETENAKIVRNLEDQLLKEREKVKSSCKRIDELLSSNREERDVMENAARGFGKVRAELEGEIKTLRHEVGKQESSLEEYRMIKQEYENIQTDFEKTKQALEKSSQSITTLKDSLDDVILEKNNLQLELTRSAENHELLVNSVKEERRQLENEIEKCKSTIGRLQHELDHHTSQSKDTEYLLKEKNDELVEVKKNVEHLEKARETGKEFEIELRHRLDEMTRELEKYQHEEDRSEKLAEANKKIKELEETLESKSLTLEEERQDILAKTKEFVLQRESDYSEKTANWERELSNKEQLLASKCEEICQLSHRLEAEQRSKEILMNEIEDREEQLELENEKKCARTPRKLRTMEASLEEERKMTKSLQDRCFILDELIMKEQNNRVALEKELKSLKDERPIIEAKEEQITALECQFKAVTEQIAFLKKELEEEKENNIMLENEISCLKGKETSLKERLESTAKAYEVLKKDYEQMKQKETDHCLQKNESVLYEEADSMKVCELECYIDTLKKEMVEQEAKTGLTEENLKRAVEETSVLQIKQTETMKENEVLQDKLEQNINEIRRLEEKIAELEKHLIKEEKDNEMKMLGLKEEISTQKQAINELTEKTNNLQDLLHEKTTSLTSKDQAMKDLENELEAARQLANETKDAAGKLQDELQQTKCLLKNATDDLKFLETMKEEVLKVEEKCGTLRAKCDDYEKRLQQEKCCFNKERQNLKKTMKDLTNSYDDVKEQLEHLQEERQPMAERLVHLEGEMIMIPKEIDSLKKELQSENENATKYKKLCEEYLQKLNKMTSVAESVVTAKKLPNDDKVSLKALTTQEPRDGQPLKEKPCVEKLALSQKNGQIVDTTQSEEATATTPLLMDEELVFLSPVTRSMSNLGFSTPIREKTEIKKTSPPYMIRRISTDVKATESTGHNPKISESTSHSSNITKLPSHISKITEPQSHVSKITKLPSHISQITQPTGHSSKITEPQSHVSKITIPASHISQITEPTCRSSRITKPTGHISQITEPTSHTSKITKPVSHSSRTPTAANLKPKTRSRLLTVPDVKPIGVGGTIGGIKKRKDEGVDKDADSKAKRIRIGSVNSPFVLERHREVQTRSKTSSMQSRLAQPRTRSQLQQGRSRIPKRTTGGTPFGQGSTSQIPKSKPSSDECKMQ